MTRPESRRTTAKRIAGIAIRTTNAAESNPSTATIPGLWARFTNEGWPQRLERVGGFGPVTAVYAAYESDVSGSYELLVGREVPAGASVPAPLHVLSAAPGTYLVFPCSGPLPQAVIDGWKDVWAYFARPNAPRRAYTCDFEVYSDVGPVEIWVAVRGAD